MNAAYAGWPDRMAVVGVDGKIAYYGGKGPGGFKPQEVEKWLKEFCGDDAPKTDETAESAKQPEWPQLKGNSGFTGLSPDDSVKPPLKLLWSYRLDGDASGDAGAGVIVAGGKVFVPVANSHSIVALDADDGRFCWEYRDQDVGWDGYLGHTTVPSYDNGRLIFWRRLKSSGVVALDAGTGKVQWTQPLSEKGKDISRGGLPVVNGLVYCSEGGSDPAVTAFHTSTGKQAWRTHLGSEIGEFAVGPTVAGGRVFVSTRANQRRGPKPDNFRGATTALDAKTGDILWSRKNVYSWSPMASDGEVLACPMWSSPDEKLYLLDCATGKTIWAKTRVANHYNPPITFTKTQLLYQPWGPILHSLSRATGEPQWIFHNKFTSAGCCTPAVSGQFAYIGTSVPIKTGDIESLRGFRLTDSPSDTGKYGTVNAIDLSTGKSVWRFPTTNTVCGDPAIAYGRLYFASRDGRVYCCAPAGPDEPMTPEAKDQSPAADPAEVARLLKSHDDTVQQPPNWPMQGGGPDRAGLAGTTLKTPLEAAWKFNTHGRVVTSAAIVDGIVYSGSESGTIVAVDEKRGQKLWQFDTSQPIRCSPAVAGGVVYCGSDSGILHALDARTGKPLWQFATGGAIQASPAIVGGVILFGANDHNLYALDRRTGRKLWNFRTSRSFIQAPPVVHGDHVFAAGWSDWVWCLDAKTGKPVWKSFIPVSIEAVAWYRDQLWVRSPYFVVRLDPADGSWQRIAETSYGYGGMAFVGDRLFQSGVLGQYGTLGATSVALNGETSPPPEQVAPTLKGVKMLTPATLRNPNLAPAEVSFRARMSVGMVAMQGSPELASMGTPLSLGDKLCFATLHGKVILTDLDGRPLWSHDLGAPSHAPPVAVNGLLVVGCDDGYVYAFRSKPDPEQEAK